DAAPLFCALLDREKGGQLTVAPEGVVAARQYYERDTGVLITEHQTPTGPVRLTDALALRSRADLTDDAPAHRGALIRSVAVVEGGSRIGLGIQRRGGARAVAVFIGVEIQACARPALRLHLLATRLLDGLWSTHTLGPGVRLDL